MSRSARRACGALALLVASTASCLRPTAERVRQDEAVGRAESSEASVVVEGGHAVVRELGPARLALWASAPRLRFELELREPAPGDFSIDVHNCMPFAELSFDDALVVVHSAGRSSSGVCSYAVDWSGARRGPESELTLRGRVEPPGAAEAGAFRFAVLSDIQEAIDAVQDIYAKLNAEPGVHFLLGAGDLTEQGTRGELRRFQRELESLSIPYYTTLGNHELGQRPTLYHEHFGRGSQSFVYKGVRFTLLDSASASIDPTVFEWLDEWLALGREQPHLVAMHVPPLDPVGVRNGAFANRNEAAKLLGRLAQNGVDLTIYGHIHSYYHFENAGISAHVSGGGGAVPERFDNLGRHYLLIDADPGAQAFQVRIGRVD